MGSLVCGRRGCKVVGPHECLELPFDDDKDVTPEEREYEETLYPHG